MWVFIIIIAVLFLLLVLKGEAKDNFIGALGCSVVGILQIIMAALPIVVALLILGWLLG
jgi:hypothetical protein